MKMYETINYVLANYFSMIVECGSSEEGISALRKDLAKNSELTKDLKDEMERALNDQHYSWKNAFIECECSILYDVDETEDEARAYAKKILWDALFAG